MDNISAIPSATIQAVRQTIFEYSMLFQPYKDDLLKYERSADPCVLESLVASDNPLTNHAASVFVEKKSLSPDWSLPVLAALLARLQHNDERLAAYPPQKVMLLAHYDRTTKELVPCQDILRFVLLVAVCDVKFPFLFPS